MVTLVRLGRVVVLLLIAATVISCLGGIVSDQTGPWEKAALGVVIVGLFVLAAAVTTLAERIRRVLAPGLPTSG